MKVATWNLEDLFRPGGRAGPRSEQEYRAKLHGLAGTITAMAPDVLAVQEVGESAALADLVERLDGAWHTELAEPDARGIRVGFLSRHPLTDVDQFVTFAAGVPDVRLDDDGATTNRMTRPALTARVRTDGVELTLLTCHLKSRGAMYPGRRSEPRDEDERARYAVYTLGLRAAEAATVRAHTTRLLNEGARGLIVLGDLNDGVHAATTTILRGPPGDRGDPLRMWNCAALIPEDRRYSRSYPDRRELIDHILVSDALTTRVDEVTTVDTLAGRASDGSRDVPASNHRPVIATIDLR